MRRLNTTLRTKIVGIESEAQETFSIVQLWKKLLISIAVNDHVLSTHHKMTISVFKICDSVVLRFNAFELKGENHEYTSP